MRISLRDAVWITTFLKLWAACYVLPCSSGELTVQDPDWLMWFHNTESNAWMNFLRSAHRQYIAAVLPDQGRVLACGGAQDQAILDMFAKRLAWD